MAHSFKGFLGVGKQTGADLRQAVVARTHFARFHELEFPRSRGEEVDPTSGRSEPESVSLGNYDQRFRGTLEGTTEGPIVPLARSVLGGAITTTTVGTTGKQHVIPVADTPSAGRLSLERNWGTAAGGDAEAINGIASSLRYNAQQPGYARWEVEGLGSLPSRVATATVPTYPIVGSLLSQRISTFSLDASTAHIVRNFSWGIRRVLDEDDYDVTSQHRRDAEYGEVVADFDAEVTFANMDNLRRFWGGATVTAPSDTEAYYAVDIKTERADVIAGGTAKHTSRIVMPKVFITGCSDPFRGRDQIRQRIQGRGIYSAADTKAVEVTLINTVAAYV